MNRRTFLAGGAAAMASGLAATLPAQASPASTSRRPRIALIGTEVRTHSHAQHFIDRFLLGYAWEGG